ncbi:MAG TPA: 16S rRNA processing protein RimM [Clostridia bacterium]|nr:16S rRNA processing protein RimM [Clostridia bacterium]
MSSGDEYLSVGKVVSPFGIEGEIAVVPTTDWPERFYDLKHVFIEQQGGPPKEVSVDGCRFHKGRVLLKLRGVENRSEAEKMKGLDLWIPKCEAVPLPEGHCFVGEIIGRRVYTTSGEPLGSVRAILRTGSNDVYVTKTDRGEEILIPATREVVQSLDPRVEVRLLPGLLEACRVPAKRGRKVAHGRRAKRGEEDMLGTEKTCDKVRRMSVKGKARRK